MTAEKKTAARQRSTAKGHAAVAMAKRFFEARSRPGLPVLIETAPNVVIWIPVQKGNFAGPKIPRSTRHDFFGVWDLLVVEPYRMASSLVPAGHVTRAVYFVQVTETSNLSHRKAKILASGFPCSEEDLVMGYRGRGVFRVLRGPRFDHEEEWRVPPPKKKTTP
jgi:hypothetical protein